MLTCLMVKASRTFSTQSVLCWYIVDLFCPITFQTNVSNTLILIGFIISILKLCQYQVTFHHRKFVEKSVQIHIPTSEPSLAGFSAAYLRYEISFYLPIKMLMTSSWAYLTCHLWANASHLIKWVPDFHCENMIVPHALHFKTSKKSSFTIQKVQEYFHVTVHIYFHADVSCSITCDAEVF